MQGGWRLRSAVEAGCLGVSPLEIMVRKFVRLLLWLLSGIIQLCEGLSSKLQAWLRRNSATSSRRRNSSAAPATAAKHKAAGYRTSAQQAAQRSLSAAKASAQARTQTFELPRADKAPRPSVSGAPQAHKAAMRVSTARAAEAASSLQRDYPNTFLAADATVDRIKIFDPALKQFENAYRLSDPRFDLPGVEAAWRQARAQVIAYLLRLIAASPWQQHLVLRGSLLLKAWLGEAAREPKDIDWVFQPGSVSKDSPQGLDLFEDLAARVALASNFGDIELDADQIRTDEIWTYDRASGRRILFPWRSLGLPLGEVQMDVVFQEELPEPAIRVALSDLIGESPSQSDESWLWAASPALSLAWKILWLETDYYPRGKDLYDAVLLAEQVALPLPLLKAAIAPADPQMADRLTTALPSDWLSQMDWSHVRMQSPWVETGLEMEWYDLTDWKEFRLEYPELVGQAEEALWSRRLCQAIAPTFIQQA